MKKIAVVLLFSTVVVAPAFAADNGLYAGVTLGRSKTGNPYPGTSMTKSTDTVMGVLGGYQFTRNFGAEVFFTGAGKFAATGGGGSGSGKTDVWGIDAVGTLPLSDAFSLYGKLGYASAKTSASSVPAGLTGATRSAATYGLGGVYNLNQSIGIRLGWDHYAAATAGGNVAGAKDNFNSDVYSLGAVFKF